jgi:hypothetical protein
MLYSQTQPLGENERLVAEEASSGGFAYGPEARSDQRIGGRRRMKPPIDPPYSYRFGERQLTSGPPSIGRRIFRTLARFAIAVLIGVGATLGWQSYGDVAEEMLVARVPALAWALPVSTKSPAVAATSTDPMQQLAPLASNLEVVRRYVEQLAAKQGQMAQNIAALQVLEEDVRQKVSSAPSAQPGPSAPAPQATSIPQPKPPQPRTHSSVGQSLSVPRQLPPAGPELSR